MRNTQPISYSVNPGWINYSSHQKGLQPQKLVSNITPHNPKPLNQPTTQMTVKDIDDQIRRLHQQYQSMNNASSSFQTERKDVVLGSPKQLNDLHKDIKQLNSLNSQFLKEPKNTNSNVQNKNNYPLSSMDYLKPISANRFNKNIRDSESTGIGIGDTSRNPPYFSDLNLNQTQNTEPNQKSLEYTNYNVSPSYANSSLLEPKILDYLSPNNFIDFPSPKTQDINRKIINFPKDIQTQIVQTTKIDSEFIRIKQYSSNHQIPIDIKVQRQTQRSNNHIRSASIPTPSAPNVSYQNTNLSKINQTKLKQTNSVPNPSIGSYIETINDKNKQLHQLQTKIYKLECGLRQKQDMLQKYKSTIQKLNQTNKSNQQNNTKTINNLRKDIELNDIKRYNNNIQLQSKFHKINIQNQQLSLTNNNLQKQINNLKKQLSKNKLSTNINEQMYTSLKNKVTQKNILVIELQKSIDRLRDQNSNLKRKLSQIINQNNSNKESILNVSNSIISTGEDKNQTFNSILKLNEEENIRYKNNLSIKDEQIYRLEEINRQLRGTVEVLKNDIEIEKLKRMTDVKNLETTFKIEEQVKDNQIQSLNRTLTNLEEKLKFIIQEEKKKDQFMVDYLRNRASTGEEKLKIQQFFKKFQLLSVNINIVQCLKREQTEIDLLKAEVRKLILKR